MNYQYTEAEHDDHFEQVRRGEAVLNLSRHRYDGWVRQVGRDEFELLDRNHWSQTWRTVTLTADDVRRAQRRLNYDVCAPDEYPEVDA